MVRAYELEEGSVASTKASRDYQPSDDQSFYPGPPLEGPDEPQTPRASTDSPCPQVFMLRTVLGIGFFVSMIILSASVLLTIIPEWNHSSEDLGKTIRTLVQRNIEKDILAFVEPLKKENAMVEDAWEAGVSNFNAPASDFQAFAPILRLFYSLVSNHPDTSVKFGRDDGFALGVVRRGRLLGWQGYDISNQTNIRRRKFEMTPLGDQGDLIGYDQFDARTIGWYKSSKLVAPPPPGSKYSRAWRPLFFSQLKPDPKLSFSTTYWENGDIRWIINSDLDLKRVNRFLDELRATVTTGGEVYIMNIDFELIGSSAHDVIIQEGKNILVNDSVSNLVAVTGSYLRDTYTATQLRNISEPVHHTVKVGSTNCFVTFSLVRDDTNFEWVTVSVIPTDEVIGDVNRAQNRSLLVVAAVTLACVILAILWLSGLSRSLRQVSRDMGLVANMQLDQVEDIVSFSHVTEVKTIQHAFNSMKHGLTSFQKYVPAPLVQALMTSGQEAKLGLRLSPITVMFMDIENFTVLTEQTKDDQLLTQVLSEYFGTMSDIIMNNHGTVDKYIGDAIMAFWNAPISVPNHEFLACKAAIECKQALERLQKDWRIRGLPVISNRTGINTGPALVGNFGSEARMDYTVIGDTVNVASRLEGLNKQLGTRIAISATVYQQVQGRALVRPLVSLKLKGKSDITSVFELVTLESTTSVDTKEGIEAYWLAYDAYCNGSFDQAKAMLEKQLAADEALSQDRPFMDLLTQTRRYVVNPPSDLDLWKREDGRVGLRGDENSSISKWSRLASEHEDMSNSRVTLPGLTMMSSGHNSASKLV